jgi:N-acetylglucosamine kinase-like BadF-type ATPase
VSYVLAVDAGNTKTIALVACTDGTILSSARGGCGDIYNVYGRLSPDESARQALATVDTTVRSALAGAGLSPESIEAAGFSMAGADWPEDLAFLHDAMSERGFGRQIRLVNDAIGALYAGTVDGVGVSVACGTGLAIGARAANGREWHSGFWIESSGAYVIGNEALRLVRRAYLGLDPPTSLTARLLAYVEVDNVGELIHALTARTSRKRQSPAALARLLLDEAAAGDAAAKRVVEQQGASCAEYVLAAARQVGVETEPFVLSLSGGVMRHPSRLLSDAVVTQVRTSAPGVQTVLSRFEPIVGALFMGLEATGVAIDGRVLARITETLPPSTVFAT